MMILRKPVTNFSMLVLACWMGLGCFLNRSTAQELKPAPSTPDEHHHHATSGESSKVENVPTALSIPDVAVVDQDGKKINFYTDLVKGKVVAINFIFTTCTTICPPMGATFSKIQRSLGTRMGKAVRLISVSVDPVTDTPPRLKAWREKFHPGQGWTLVTGEKTEIDKLLKALGSYSASKEDHTPLVLIGNDAEGAWTRAYGLAPAEELTKLIDGMVNLSAVKAAEESSTTGQETTSREGEDTAAQKYFTDVVLVNQNGEKMRFYSDLLKDKVVVISSFFTSCTGICPPMNRKLAQIQEALGEHMGKDVHILSLSVDPLNDTPPRLKAYAETFHAGPGWYFLTGKKENVDWALYKMGQYVEDKEDHSTLLIIGNEPKKLWKKAMVYAPTDQLVGMVQEVLKAR